MIYQEISENILQTIYNYTIGNIIDYWNNMDDGLKILIILGIFSVISVIFIIKKILKFIALLSLFSLGIYLLITTLYPNFWIDNIENWNDIDVIKKLLIIYMFGFSFIFIYLLSALYKKFQTKAYRETQEFSEEVLEEEKIKCYKSKKKWNFETNKCMYDLD